jgi:hypothetical protein
MRRLPLQLLLVALLASRAFAASVFQLDVCNKHRTVSEAPGTALTVTKVRSWGSACSKRAAQGTSISQLLGLPAGSTAARSQPSWLHPGLDTPDLQLLIPFPEAQGLPRASLQWRLVSSHPASALSPVLRCNIHQLL